MFKRTSAARALKFPRISPSAIAFAAICLVAAADASAQCSIQFTSPARGSTVTTSTVTVSGSASGFAQQFAQGTASATANGTTFFSYSGVFTAQMNFGGGAGAVATLQPGANRLTVTGSVSGCSDSDSMVIYYVPPPPVGQKSAGRPRDENCSNPVNGATGNKYQMEVDHVAAAGSPLVFERHYNASFTQSRALGRGWRHSYDRQLTATGTGTGSIAYIVRPDGMAYRFTKSASGWTTDADITARLVDAQVANQTQWQLTMGEDNSTEVYNTNGRLISIAHANARRVDVSYDEGGRLQYVADVLSGRRLSFTYTAVDSAQIATMTDPAGNVFTFHYTGATDSQRLTSVVYPGQNAPTRQYLYNESAHTGGANLPDALTGIVDENGDRYATFGYDATGRGAFTEHAGGVERYSMVYNPDGSTSVTDPLGADRTYTYATVQGVRRQVGQNQPAGAGCPASASARTYDANGNIATSTDFSGNLTVQTWDLARNLLTQKVEASATPEARTTSTEWHLFWRLPIRVAEPMRRITYVYNGDTYQGSTISCAPAAASIPSGISTRPAPLLCREIHEATTDASGAAGFSASVSGQPRTWAYTYNAAGQVLTGDGPRTDVSDAMTYAYHSTANSDHAIGDFQRITNAQSHTIHLDRFDGNGHLLNARDANGVVLSHSWHPRGWQLSRAIDGLTNVYERDAVGQLLSVTSPDGSKLDYGYDAARRLISETDMAGRAKTSDLDNLGNITQTDWVDPGNVLARRLASSFDVLGREQSSTETRNGVNFVTQYGYDANGNRRLITDPKNQSTNLQFDGLNRNRQITDALSGVTQLTHDARDQLTQMQAPNGAVTTFTVNGLGNVTREVSSNSGTTNVSYDAAGNLVTLTDARGITQTRTYDALNRLVSVSYPTPSENVSYTWDNAPGCTNGIGRLCAVTDNGGSSRFAYDTRGNLVSHTRTVSGVDYTTTYVRDTADRLISLTDPIDQTVNYIRDSDGVIEQITTDAEGQPQLKLVDQVKVNAAGLTTSLLMGNGVSLERTYAEDGRLLEQLGTPSQADLGLSYDANGNVATRTLPGLNATYGYDALDRLISQPPSWAPNITYDANGNRLSDSAGSKTYAPNSDRLATRDGQNVTLDAAGNTLQSGVNVYTWNQAGHLKTVSRGTALVATYFYDYRGLRSRRITTAEAQEGISDHLYHYDEDGRLIAETTATVSPRRTYVWRDNTPQAIIVHAGAFARSTNASGRALYLEVDHLKTPVAASNQSGTKVWNWLPDAFGSSSPDEDPDLDGEVTRIHLRFPGQYSSDGLYYNWNRYYDPTMGRYISADPIGIAGGSNVYAYASGNPLSYTDPLGLQAYGGQTPPSSIPGGPWTPAGSGQPPGTFYGPKNPNGGPRDVCRYVPDGANGGPSGAKDSYWKTKEPGKPWTRFDQNGKPITPEQAHPGNKNNRPMSPLSVPGWMPLYPLVCPLCDVLMPPSNGPS